MIFRSVPMSKIERSPAHSALMNYQQADEDGVMVLVSRQAIHEVSEEIERLRAALHALTKALEDEKNTPPGR